ncbi:hypothetical protein OTK49_28370 [Vibrio coralliirubri]|uniref:hypothetical protein n=1 Tax=Vibrio coralliirubri TaxID=1516159 RepID=UPI002283F21E|nr:hypothetical protein [Vibrio coralliirubri]MCY9866459.1 hypothetical protein [Vibrio coralliirubri]
MQTTPDNTNALIRELFKIANDPVVMGNLLLKDEQDFLFSAYKKLNKSDDNTSELEAQDAYNLVKLHFKQCIDTMIEIGAVYRVHTPDGVPFISGRNLPSDHAVYHYRPHYGSLDESMAHKEPFFLLDDLENILMKRFEDTSIDFESAYVRFDERINWDTYILTDSNAGGVIGFTNVNPKILHSKYDRNGWL